MRCTGRCASRARWLQAPAADSDAYFASRPWPSRIGAWASAQSEPVASREALLGVGRRGRASASARRCRACRAPRASRDIVIPRPPHWGGYHLWAESVELWVEGEARVHDRARWRASSRQQPSGYFEAGPWTATRLQP